MFFRKSPYLHRSDVRPAKVLALYSSTFIGEIRIKPYLNALLGRGVIADYQVADRAMTMEGLKTYSFTHIWCQRNVSTAQFAFLKANSHVPIIYDMDDLLTSMPDFVASSKRTMLNRVAWCLKHAAAITVASDRLKASLQEDAPVSADRIMVLKNGCSQCAPPERADGRRQLVWTSSDVPFFLRENPQFATNLATLLNREGYEAILIGQFDQDLRGLFERSRHIGHLDFTSYRGYLRTLAGGVAIAPMPTRLPQQAQRYFDAKSDVKLVDYLSSGLIPIVSDAASYATSELFMPQLAASDADALLQRLATCIANRKAATQAVDAVIHQPGLLKHREFSELSKSLDSLFV
ncbi:hypothetical protein [Bradyrhizobium sp. LHD-71]|uniref:hypothetical protein n=1 Tax=Bradyrhizobium sp. LHD-71 TaxID=3072141 RepID=UPI00280C5F2C|nr:hypothetical protein [Bradyrhizobium sp. LHD-71]MDQ8727732.1 hypothetical protein [Bradyrhizobium sp. LHD-71]